MNELKLHAHAPCLPVLSAQTTLTDPSVSTDGSCLTIAWRFAIRITPRANVTVTTIGRPSGIAATAKLTTGITKIESTVENRTYQYQLTSNSKHFEPASFLKEPYQHNDTNDTKREDR